MAAVLLYEKVYYLKNKSRKPKKIIKILDPEYNE
jgi:hypothetical protein